jgi:quinol monooxygenase YgiN
VLIIAGSLRVAAADRATYLGAVEPATRLARAAPGCLDFVQAPDPLDSERIVIFKRWESHEPLLTFRTSDPDSEPLQNPPIISADVHRYEISAVGEP